MLDKYLLKIFLIFLPLLILADLISYLASNWTALANIIYLLIILAVLILSIKDLRWGFYVVLAELMIGSQGHLFDLTLAGQQISLRKGLFITVLLVWLIGLLFKKGREFFQSKFLPYYLPLFIFIILAAIGGLLNNSSVSWFHDFNGWLFWLLAPAAFAAINNFQRVKEVLTVFFSALVFLSVKTLYLLIIFAYGWPNFVDCVYEWLRYSRLAEPTFIADNLFRIFSQSQVYLLAGFFIALTLLFFDRWQNIKKNLLWSAVILSSLALLISLSRSYWVGWFGGAIFLLGYLFIKVKIPAQVLFQKFSSLIIILTVMVVFLQALTGNFVQAALGARLGQASGDPAGQSRLQQLKPLADKIANQPMILGSGFGAEVSYVSSDPRVLRDQPDGLYSTYAFEWGYLDIWLKLGLLGLLAYLLLIAKIGLSGLKSGPLGIGLAVGLAAIAITSIFSPYLNHPLGIGYIIMMTAIINLEQNKTENHGKS
ncbi:MAG: O-antigen ligase family protein [Candidatus Komeilibacteria bacterium]|nr:O-antigen ligase family protein [Candidatus Komeilibacteria bacterium]